MNFLKNKLKLQKLNSRGFSHHLLVPVLVVLAIGGVGAKMVFDSQAYTLKVPSRYVFAPSTQKGCWLAGRIWKSDNTCAGGTVGTSTPCRSKSTTYRHVKDSDGNIRGYCTGAVALESSVSQTTCVNSLHRVFVKYIGCARRIDQDNTNKATQCIGNNVAASDPLAKYKNYVADGGADRCVEDAIVTSPTVTAVTDKIADAKCRQLGRTVKSAGVCNRVCTTNTGTLLHGTNYYCNLAVATGSKEWCDNLRRVWLDDGCAKRAAQDDAAGAIQCANSSYKYYHSNFINKGKNPDVKTATDVCEKSATTAAQNEQWGVLGAKLEAAKAACDTNSAKIWNAATSTCINKATGSSTGGTNGGSTTTGPLCVTDQPDASGAQAGQYVPAGQTCPAGTHSLCTNNAAPVNGTCPDGATTAGVVVTGGTDGIDANGDPAVATPAGFKIVVYADKNFKGASKTYTSDQADLKTSGMNDKVSSYKILRGRWQLCPDANYKGTANVKCTRPWASNPDLSAAKTNNFNNKLSSLRPVTTTELVDAGDDVLPSCKDGNGLPVQPNEDNTCPANSSLQCPAGYQIVNADCKQPVVTHEQYLPVDKSFSGKAGQEKCLLLGREWVPNGNGGDHGCSTVTCNAEKDGAPRFSGDAAKAYCVSYAFDAPYAVVLDKDTNKSKKACTDLHRVWVNQVDRCAQVPNRKDKDQTIVKSDRCTGAFTTYYIFKATAKNDECFKPGFFQKAKGVAKVTKSNLGKVLNVGPQAFCKAKKGYHWSNGKCRKDPPPPRHIGQPNGDHTTGSFVATVGYCAGINRKPPINGKCEHKCTSGNTWSGVTDSHGYDTCIDANPAPTSHHGDLSHCDVLHGSASYVACAQCVSGYHMSGGHCVQDVRDTVPPKCIVGFSAYITTSHECAIGEAPCTANYVYLYYDAQCHRI